MEMKIAHWYQLTRAASGSKNISLPINLERCKILIEKKTKLCIRHRLLQYFLSSKYALVARFKRKREKFNTYSLIFSRFRFFFQENIQSVIQNLAQNSLWFTHTQQSRLYSMRFLHDICCQLSFQHKPFCFVLLLLLKVRAKTTNSILTNRKNIFRNWTKYACEFEHSSSKRASERDENEIKIHHAK